MKIEKIGVIGAGQMGNGIAHVCALAGYDVNAAGGPAYCCGTAHDHQPRGASNMAARTVGRFNEAAEKEGRGKVVTWCPSCHMHMSDIMAPGNPLHDLKRGGAARNSRNASTTRI